MIASMDEGIIVNQVMAQVRERVDWRLLHQRSSWLQGVAEVGRVKDTMVAGNTLEVLNKHSSREQPGRAYGQPGPAILFKSLGGRPKEDRQLHTGVGAGVDSWLPRPLHTRSAVFFYRPARQILQPLESFRLCLRRLWDQGSDSDLLTHQRVEIHEVRPMGRSLFSKMTYQWVAPPWMNQKKCDRSSAPPDGDRVNYRNVYQTAITTN